MEEVESEAEPLSELNDEAPLELLEVESSKVDEEWLEADVMSVTVAKVDD